MADALERDLKKGKMGQRPTTMAHREPALSFHYDESSVYTLNWVNTWKLRRDQRRSHKLYF